MSRAVDSTARAMAGEALSRLDNGGSGSGGTTVDAYSKLETDNLLNAKVDDVEFTPIKALAESNEINITYLANNKAEKTEVNALSELVADIDSEVDLKANASDVYTKTETNTAISDKVAEIVANAPEDFDTLKEMSDWIDSHEDSASAMNTAIKQNTSDIANLKATAETTATEIASIKSDVAINRTTLGTECKNLLPYKFVNGVAGGVVINVDDDGIVTLQGTTTTSLTYNVNFLTPLQFDRDVFITGASSLTNIIYSCKTDVKINGSNYPTIGTKGLLIPAGVTISYLYLQQTATGKEVSATIEPMIVYADVLDRTYEPYQPSLQEQITANANNVSDMMTGVYLHNKASYGVFTEGYVMRVGNQVHINCKVEFTRATGQWIGDIITFPFKVKSPNSDGSKYTIANTQSDGRTTSIYINEGSKSFFSSTTFSVGDVIEIKGLILDMYVDDTATTQEA